MLAHIENYFRPQSLDEALALLGDPNNNAIPLAGATAVGINQGVRHAVKTLVDLSHTGLDRVWEDEEGLHLGAMVRATELYRSPTIHAFAGHALSESAFAIASEPIRNLTSLGGNVVHITAWSDLPPALQVLDARFRIQGQNADRVLSCSEFLGSHPKKHMNAGELLTEVIIERPASGSGTSFIKHCKTAVDFALVNGAALVTLDGDNVADIRLSVGAIHTPPIRLPDAEAILQGNRITEQALEQVSQSVSAAVSPKKDARASEEYLRHCAGVVIKRCIVKAAERARSSS
jgi:carbon-monoxide dehydrogenase medium subunit